MNVKPLLRAEGLSKSFGGLMAVHEVSFAVAPGEILGLIGPNGSGKTTLLNLVAGVFPPERGRIYLEGEDVTRLPNHARVRRRINRTFQLVRLLPSLTVRENVLAGALFGADPAARAAALLHVERLLTQVGLAEKAGMMPDQVTYIDQKRVELARALATGPRVLLLDEWLSGLNDAELTQGMAQVRSLAERGLAVVLVEHVMTAVRALCGRVLVMNAGERIAEGPPAAVLRDPEVVRAYLGGSDA
jgi:ABC-type branched-subunit amino acid transport system ATPase component